jgi:hypothetical protein
MSDVCMGIVPAQRLNHGKPGNLAVQCTLLTVAAVKFLLGRPLYKYMQLSRQD